MRKILLKFLFATLFISGSAIYSQTALPGTVEAETGTFGGIVGTSGVGVNNLRGGSANFVTNSVSVATAGDYDFTFTYNRSGAAAASVTMEIVDPATGLFSAFSMPQTSGFETVTKTGVTLPVGTYDIKFYNANGNGFNLDKYEVTASVTKPTITLLGSTPVSVTQGNTYTDASATALASDGVTDITGDIVTVNPVNTAVIGTYTVTYNVTNGGVAADEVTRTVNVVSATTNATLTGNWNDTATWGGNPVPGSSDDVFVPDGVVVTVTDARAANTLKVTNDANVVVSSGGALSVTGDIFLGRFDGGLVVQSETAAEAMGTLTVGGSVHTMNTDDATTSTTDKRLLARRTLTNDKWYLVSSISSKQPRVNRMTDSDFRTNATPAYAIGVYNNGNASNSKYEYFSTTLTNSDEVTLGAGMSVSVNGTGNTNTTGEFEYKAFFSHGSSITVAIAQDGGTSDAFNLLGNPYLSNLYGNTNANATNLLSTNSGVLAEQTMWFWNPDTEAFVTKNQSSAAFTVPPLTGFFVKSSVAGGNFSYTTAMETHTASGSVLSKNANQRFEVDLKISNGELNRSASILFIDRATTAFDNGYDSSMFGGFSSALEIYTGLVADNTGKRLAIQSLPSSNFENMVIPVGVTATANSEITISANVLNIAKGYDVVLEDRTNNVFTSLTDENSVYTTTVSEKNTDGRFFLHVTASVLSTESKFLDSVSLFTTDNSNVRIVGLQNGNATFQLFNILGEQVLSTSFKSKNVNNISLPRLSSGVYIVQLNTPSGKLNKKIVLK